ncbi:hypothetical protein FB107DRAFT_204339 [Schizophyllum commune]
MSIDALPDEVLEAIFYTLILAVDGPIFSVFSTAPNVHLIGDLALVCRRWHAVLLGNPHIWARARIHLYGPSGARNARVFERAMDALARSGDLPLTVTFRFESLRNSDLAIAPLLRTCRRWQTAHLHIPDDHFELPELQSMKGELPLLRSLSLSLPRLNMGLHKLPRVVDTFRHCPMLKSVTLWNEVLGPVLDLPWTRLTSLTVQGWTVDDVIKCVADCTALERLTVHDVLDDANGAGSDHIHKHLTHTTIRALHLTSGSWAVRTASLLNRLTLPSLEEFHIAFWRENLRQWPQLEFLNLLSRSGCSLSTLALHRVGLSIEELTEVLRAVPELTSLSFEDTRSAMDDKTTFDWIFSWLMIVTNTNSDQPTPDLAELSIDLRTLNVTQARIENMLSTRLQRGKLRRAVLRIPIDFDTSIRSLADEGLDLVLSGAEAKAAVTAPAFDDVLNSLEGPKEDAIIRLVDKSVVPPNVVSGVRVYLTTLPQLGIFQRLHLAQEWGLFWYLGFDMYMASPWNQISLPSDAAELFRNGDFVFVPTFKTYKETMTFRLNESGVYRYFFVPLSKKGRAIAHKLCQLGHLGEQTLEDRNCGIHPITGEVLPSRIQAYPIFKTYAHPASVCFSVWTTLQNRKLNLRDPDALAGRMPLPVFAHYYFGLDGAAYSTSPILVMSSDQTSVQHAEINPGDSDISPEMLEVQSLERAIAEVKEQLRREKARQKEERARLMEEQEAIRASKQKIREALLAERKRLTNAKGKASQQNTSTQNIIEVRFFANIILENDIESCLQIDDEGTSATLKVKQERDEHIPPHATPMRQDTSRSATPSTSSTRPSTPPKRETARRSKTRERDVKSEPDGPEDATIDTTAQTQEDRANGRTTDPPFILSKAENDGMLWNLNALGPTGNITDSSYTKAFTRQVISRYDHYELTMAYSATFNGDAHPQLPGLGTHGIIFGSLDYKDLLPIFVRVQAKQWLYCGHYRCTMGGILEPNQLKSVRRSCLTTVAKDYADKAEGRIGVAKQNEENEKVARQARLPYQAIDFTVDGIRAALLDGRLPMTSTVLRFVQYDKDWFQRALEAESATPRMDVDGDIKPPNKRKANTPDEDESTRSKKQKSTTPSQTTTEKSAPATSSTGRSLRSKTERRAGKEITVIEISSDEGDDSSDDERSITSSQLDDYDNDMA